MVAIVSRSQLGLGGSTAGRAVPLSSRRWFVGHWPGGAVGADARQVWRNIDAFHRNTQRWAVIGYNYGIARDGTIFEGAGLMVRGIHSPPRNTDGFGVCFLVAPGEALPEPMRRSARALYDWLNRQTGRTLGRAGHSTHHPTACPGPAVMAFINAGLPATGGTPPPPPPPPGGGSAPAWPGRILINRSPMMNGADVRTWQTRCRVRGWGLAADGWYGPVSERTCREVQTIARIGVDGRVGPNTWPATWASNQGPGGGAPAPTPPASTPFPAGCAPWFGRTARNRCTGVRAFQQRMRDRFRYTIAVDGIFGPQSEAVTRQFQQAQRIAVDGLVGPVTWGRAFG